MKVFAIRTSGDGKGKRVNEIRAENINIYTIEAHIRQQKAPFFLHIMGQREHEVVDGYSKIARGSQLWSLNPLRPSRLWDLSCLFPEASLPLQTKIPC